MIISHSKKFIFIHNYKVAGTSVHRALNRYNNSSFWNSMLLDKFRLIFKKHPAIYAQDFDWHITAKELKRKLPVNLYNSYFKFGFVRNPWDWQVSLYSYMLKHAGHQQHELVKSMRNFDEYIEWRVHEDLHLQKDFFYDEEGTCLVDFIGKMEYLYSDFTHACKQVDIKERLPHLNKSREDENYLYYYSSNSIKM